MSRPAYVPTGRRLLPARVVGRPEPGYFRIRLVKGGPWVPACIRHEPARDPVTGESLDRSFWWTAEIDGIAQGAPTVTPSHHVERIWTSGDRITEAEFWALLGDRLSADAGASPAPFNAKSSSPLF